MSGGNIASKETNDMTVMVVDDSWENLRFFERLLIQKNYGVRLFPRGDLALEAAQKAAPDLFVLDINMPEMDGFELCKRLKQEDRLAEIPIIILSARSDAEGKVRAFELGALDYIEKPFHTAEVLARIETHLALRQAQAKLELQNQKLEGTLSELKIAQTRLVQSEKLASLGILAAGVAHELNNPVNFIASAAKSLRRIANKVTELFSAYDQLTKDNAPEQLDHIDSLKSKLNYDDLVEGLDDLPPIIERGAARSADIVRGLRSFSRIDKPEKETVDLHAGLDATLALLTHRTESKVRIKRQYGNLPPITCHAGALNQVFMNLIINAVEALETAPPKGQAPTITITTSKSDGEGEIKAVISVADNGPGISAEARKHLFEPFFTTKDNNESTGLGLSISHGIVTQQGGTIEVRGEPNQGAIFNVVLPLETARGDGGD